ncbi:MAG TPA: hypothetical protein PLA82_04745 [Deltaproteobacteria bacterium]|nr:hypothetical protein [Deltaproteobacteria bacterium]
MNAIWITWENQRRNREISRALGIRLYEFKEIDELKNPARKYTAGLLKTCAVLLKERPGLVCCQNPSIVLSSFLVAIKKAAGFRVCVDAHNAGLFPAEGRSPRLMRMSAYIQRRSDLTLVTNRDLHEQVKTNQGRPFIIQDRIPDIPRTPPAALKGRHNILFICSYAEDEPYRLVFDAAHRLDPGVHIYVTGNYRKKNIDPGLLPANVSLTGYIPEERYVEMLNSVDATIDLTEREGCLVCGAYESVAVEKPQILSDTRALRRYFHKGAVYTQHTAEGIRDSIHALLNNRERLKREARELKEQRSKEWEVKRSALALLLEDMARGEAGHGSFNADPSRTRPEKGKGEG